MSLQQQMELEKRYLMPTFARKKLELVQGSGMKVFDAEGKSYLDFIAGIGVDSLGHCHPAVVKAIQAQSEQLIHVGNYYYIQDRGEVAQRLSNLLNVGSSQTGEEWKSFFANSGAEANECAIKLARLWSKKQGKATHNIVTLDKSFHGRTLATLAATAQPAKQEAFKPLPGGFMHTPINDIDALEKLFAEQGESICAVMVECVQGEGGVNPCSKAFLSAVESMAHKYDALVICDEIQTGIYRCGSQPFAFQNFGIVPDIVTIAKGVASGFPTGVCAAKTSVARAFEPGDHGTTFGGSCLAIAAIKATLDALADSDIIRNVEEVGAYLGERLSELPHVLEVRGMGLMRACDLDEQCSAFEVVEKALEAGTLINATGPQTLRFLPPLICTKTDVDALIEGLKELVAS